MDIYENYLKDNVFAQRGYVILVDDNGDYLYHPNHEIAIRNVHDEYMTKVLAESKELQDLARDYLAGKTGITKYIYLKEWKLATYTHAQITPDRFWPIMITVPLTDIHNPIKSAISRFQYLSFVMIGSLILLSLGIIISLLRWGKILSNSVQERTQQLEDANRAARNVYEDLLVEKEALARAKVKDEAIFSSIGDGIIATDSNRRIIIMNKVAEKLLGWSVKEALGKLYDDVVSLEDEKGTFIPPEDRPLNKAFTHRTTTTTTTTMYLLSKNKVKFPVAITLSPIILNNKIIGAVEVFRDITKEQEIDKAKTEFVSLASHQLRTPLTTISWYTEMILKGDMGQVVPGQKKYLEEIYHGNQRMVGLVNTLLNVSRLELGTFIVAPEPTDIVMLAKSVIDEQRPQIGEKKLHLITKFEKDIPIIQTDPKLLHMVVQNLLSNAVQYTPEGGRVEVSLSLDDPPSPPPSPKAKDGQGKKNVLMKIADTGYGIPKNQQNNIFIKFFRADNVREKDTEGTGLGLYIVKSIIEHSGGKVWFESPASTKVSNSAQAMADKSAGKPARQSPDGSGRVVGGEENPGTVFYVTLPLEGMKKKEGTKALA